MQTTLFESPVDLSDYDRIIINSSGGKDSQVMLDVVATEAMRCGVTDRLVVFHADLGRVEWPGISALAKAQAEHYSVRFLSLARAQGDLLSHIRQRGMFPDAARRYCTSEHKRGPGRRAMTQLVNELQLARPAQILNCMGFRRAESLARAKKPAFRFDESASNKTHRRVWEYCPILAWSDDEIWRRIRTSGVPYHEAYDQGMPRLSCSFCVLASRSALVRAAQLRPDLACEYAELEQETGHRFRQDLSMSDIIAEATKSTVQTIEHWNA